MRRFFVVFVLALALLVALPAAVYADVVMSNDFFDRNSKKTEPVNRYFLANGADGYVVSKEEPGSKKELERYENGNMIMIGSVYLHKGKYWGIPPIGHWYWNPGWIPMDELLMVYDNVDFEAAHSGEFYDYNGGFKKLAEADAFYLWPWPGSDREKIHHDFGKGYFSEGDFDAIHAYKDGEGREWVYITIWGGWSGGGLSMAGASAGWVCMDGLDNGGIPAFNPAPAPVLWSATAPPDWSGTSPQQPPGGGQGEGQKGWQNGSGPLVLIAIAAIAIVAAVVLFVKLRKKRA